MTSIEVQRPGPQFADDYFVGGTEYPIVHIPKYPELDAYGSLLEGYEGDAPTDDPVLLAFFEAGSVVMQNDPTVRKFMNELISLRSDMTPQHFQGLLWRAVGMISDSFPENYDNPDTWRNVLHFLSYGNNEEFNKLMLEKRISTARLGRYLPGYAYGIEWTKGRGAVTMFDGGCSNNTFLRMVATGNLQFQQIEDRTTENIIGQNYRTPIDLERGIAMDLQDPDAEENREWRTHGSTYPKNSYKQEKYRATEDKIVANYEEAVAQNPLDVPPIQFIQGDLTDFSIGSDDPNAIFPNSIDIAFLNTTLYQIPEYERVLDNMDRILKPDGICFIADAAFATELEEGKRNELLFEGKVGETYNIFAYGPGTNGQILHILEADGPKVESVKPGRDYEIWKKLLAQRQTQITSISVL